MTILQRSKYIIILFLILYGLAKAYPILERVYSVCNKPIISSLLAHRSLLCLQQD